jgi:hypothetical protein
MHDFIEFLFEFFLGVAGLFVDQVARSPFYCIDRGPSMAANRPLGL